jgi:hypothetical protein
VGHAALASGQSQTGQEKVAVFRFPQKAKGRHYDRRDVPEPLNDFSRLV